MNHVRLAFFNCFGFISIGCIISQLIPLLNESFSAFEKSLILGLGALASFFMAVLFGKLSDTIKFSIITLGLLGLNYLYINISLLLLFVGEVFFISA